MKTAYIAFAGLALFSGAVGEIRAISPTPSPTPSTAPKTPDRFGELSLTPGPVSRMMRQQRYRSSGFGIPPNPFGPTTGTNRPGWGASLGPQATPAKENEQPKIVTKPAESAPVTAKSPPPKETSESKTKSKGEEAPFNPEPTPIKGTERPAVASETDDASNKAQTLTTNEVAPKIEVSHSKTVPKSHVSVNPEPVSLKETALPKRTVETKPADSEKLQSSPKSEVSKAKSEVSHTKSAVANVKTDAGRTKTETKTPEGSDNSEPLPPAESNEPSVAVAGDLITPRTQKNADTATTVKSEITIRDPNVPVSIGGGRELFPAQKHLDTRSFIVLKNEKRVRIMSGKLFFATPTGERMAGEGSYMTKDGFVIVVNNKGMVTSIQTQ